MTTAAKQTRPAGNGTGAQERFATCPESTWCTCFKSRHCLSLAELDALADRVRGCFVVVVAKPDEDDPHRTLRRPYLTAKAAEKAARRATERGQVAAVYLAELRPVHRLVGGA